MTALRRTAQFKVDLRCQKKYRKDLEKLKRVIEDLISGRTLSREYRDHHLIGKYRGTRKCHIEPDWLLIYEKNHGRDYPNTHRKPYRFISIDKLDSKSAVFVYVLVKQV